MEKICLRGDIDVNCYIVSNENKCFIIDPGYEKSRVIEHIENNNLEVEGILLTHGHLDHIGAIDSFDVPVYIYEEEYDLFISDDINGFKTLGVENPLDISKLNIKTFSKDTKFNLGDKTIEVIHTPGHTKGSVCYIYDKMIFTGDTLFKGAVGRSDFPTGSLEALKHSVVNLIDAYSDDYEVHPGHNCSSTIGIEKVENSYYKMWK